MIYGEVFCKRKNYSLFPIPYSYFKLGHNSLRDVSFFFSYSWIIQGIDMSNNLPGSPFRSEGRMKP